MSKRKAKKAGQSVKGLATKKMSVKQAKDVRGGAVLRKPFDPTK